MKVWKQTIRSGMGVAVLGALGCGVFLGGCTREVAVAQQPQQPQAVAPQPQMAQDQPQVVVDQQPQYIVVQQAPPPVIVETRPPPPSAAYIWIDGSWNWNDQKYSWEAGRYAIPPRAGAVWIAPHYQPDARGGRYTPGQWRK